ncbi:MAG: LysR family transcriptional regulator [Candidatus Caenarcaniphilales bacterium]|nr:LysR family transcriptional regulator [Candidatus Caenarcaniphilales bacterium]
MSFDLKDLEAIRSINEFGSINSAAEKIYLSKSALSERIKKLEARLGFEILIREGYKVKLTRQAKFLLAHSDQVLCAHSELVSKAKLIKDNVEAFFKIGVSIIFPTAVSMKLFKALTQEFPDTEFNFFREVLSGEEMLKKKVIDISISETIKDDANLDFKKVSSCDMVLLISSEHKFLSCLKKIRT